jgi:hypothetical protein
MEKTEDLCCPGLDRASDQLTALKKKWKNKKTSSAFQALTDRAISSLHAASPFPLHA